MKYEYDESSFQQAASALMTINPGGHPDADSVVRYMKATTERSLDSPGYIGTGGWYVVSCWKLGEENKTLICKATIMAFAVEQFLMRLPKIETKDSSRSFELRAEAACCLWEAMDGTRIIGNPDTALKRILAPMFDGYGSSEMRHVAISLVDTLLDVHDFIPETHQLELGIQTYDWEFVPLFLRVIDWGRLNVFTRYHGTRWAGETHEIAAAMINAAREQIEKAKKNPEEVLF